jgi:CopG family nickel-responsive transcriptional regulator
VKPSLARITISVPSPVLDGLDGMIARRKLRNRSHAIAEIIRHELVSDQGQSPGQVLAGTITLVYIARRRSLRQELAAIQRRFLKEIISSHHVFLEDQHDLEVLLVQGPRARLSQLADALRGRKGVEQVRAALTGTVLPPLH